MHTLTTLADKAIARFGERGSQVSIAYKSTVDPRRSLIEVCAEVSRGNCTVYPELRLSSDGDTCRAVFEFRGRGHAELAQAFREQIKSKDLDLTLEEPKTLVPVAVVETVTETSNVGDVVGRGVKRVVAAVVRARKQETAALFEVASVSLNDRIVVDTGKRHRPVYMTGQVVKVDTAAARVKVKLDNGKFVERAVGNGYGHVVGFLASHASEGRKTAIAPSALAGWLDPDRWTNRSAVALMTRIDQRRTAA